MKPVKGLWTSIASFDNLYQAYLSAAKGKRFRSEVLSFSSCLEDNLFALRDELESEAYKVGLYREFYVSEPKKRLVMAIPFRDRVVQWAVYRILNPVISKGYIADSFACIEGRGIHSASKRLKHFAKLVCRENGGSGYYLKLDISKYFYRVNHAILMRLLHEGFADGPLLRLLEKIICSDTLFGLSEGSAPGDGSERIRGVGMPIGNLTSQMFANLYLNELDQHAKRKMRIRRYVRYMDDIVALSGDKAQLRAYKEEIERFAAVALKLSLNNKTVLRPLSHGIGFCGFKIWGTHIKLRKPTAMKMRRRLRKLQRDYALRKAGLADVRSTIASYNGMLLHCDSRRLSRKIFGTLSEDGVEQCEGWFCLRRKSNDIVSPPHGTERDVQDGIMCGDGAAEEHR